MNDAVGPVLEASDLGRAVAEAIRRHNPSVTIVDRGAYLRVTCRGECRLERADVEAILGHAWALPGDLERVMPSFAGNIAFGRDCVRWRARDVA